MFSFNNISQKIICSYKIILNSRISCHNNVPVCSYTRKSVESLLGIDKPKKPPTPFIRFSKQMRPTITSKNPELSVVEVSQWAGKLWRKIDDEAKEKLKIEYQKDMEKYKKSKEAYESSLTDKQKSDIAILKVKIADAKEKKKLKAERLEMGKPKKPMSSYMTFCDTRKELFKGDMKEFHQKVKEEWYKLPETEKEKYESLYRKLLVKYKKDLETWELKMIAEGRSDLVATKKLREKKTKKDLKPQ